MWATKSKREGVVPLFCFSFEAADWSLSNALNFAFEAVPFLPLLIGGIMGEIARRGAVIPAMQLFHRAGLVIFVF